MSGDDAALDHAPALRTLRLPDVTLAYQEAGRGPPAVYVHGGFASLATTLWDAAEAGWTWEHDLAARLRLITYDRRGCGASSLPDAGYDLATQADDLAALLDHLGVRSAHIIGSSAGGPIAVTFAAGRPERVRSLVLVGTALDLFPRGEPGSDAVRAQLAILHRAGPEAAFARRPPEVEVTFGELWDHTEAAARGELDAYLARQARRRARARAVPHARRVAYYAAELRTMAAYLDADLASVARRISVPTLVLQGSRDQLVPLTGAEELARAIRGAQLHVVPGGSHSLMIRDAAARRFAIDWMVSADAEGGS